MLLCVCLRAACLHARCHSFCLASIRALCAYVELQSSTCAHYDTVVCGRVCDVCVMCVCVRARARVRVGYTCYTNITIFLVYASGVIYKVETKAGQTTYVPMP